MVTSPLPRLVADASLGKLVTHLRLAGIDTLFDPGIPHPDRLARLSHGERTILTRCHRIRRALRSKALIFISNDNPAMQIRQVLSMLALKRSDLMPLSRCGRCNRLLEDASRSQLVGSVPEYILQTHKAFKRCMVCGKVFWAGSHAERWLRNIDSWFEDDVCH